MFQRVPETVRVQLNERAQQGVFNPASGEIRFVCDDACTSSEASITLSSESQTQAVVHFGEYQTTPVHQLGAEPVTIDLAMPARLRGAMTDHRDHMPSDPAFDPRVRRVMLFGGPVRLHDVQGEAIRLPATTELPTRRLLTYGTSKTYGAGASAPHLTYASQTARRLGADLINLGVGGACHAESAFADYMAGRDDWTACLLALSVNMIGGGFTTEQYEERVDYMVNTIAGAHPDKPVVCVTIYPHFRDLAGERHRKAGVVVPNDFRRILREIVDRSPLLNVHVIEGREILTDFAGLSPDLIHPNDYGMTIMAERMTARLRPLIESAERAAARR